MLWITPLLVVALGRAESQDTIPTPRAPIGAGAPISSGLSKDHLDRLGGELQRHVDAGELSGAVAMIARRGRVAWVESVGWADVESGIPMRADTIFRIASMTKLVSTVAALVLHEEGRFLLSDPVSRYLPAFAEMTVLTDDLDGEGRRPARSAITLRDLLCHTAGMTYGSGREPGLDALYQMAGIRGWRGSLEGFTDTIAELPLLFDPGTRWSYSYSVDVMGRVIEVVAEEPLDEFMRTRILDPLEMDDTGFRVPEEKLSRLASVYAYDDGVLRRLESAADTPLRLDPDGLSAGGGWGELGSRGGLVSTAPDFMRLLLLLAGGGELEGERLISRKSVELMGTDHIEGMPTFLGPGVGFGLGVAVLNDVGAYGALGSKGTLWWAGSCNTYFFIDPVEQLVGLLMTQMRPFGHLDLMDRFMSLALAAIAD
jgi:CubicO group peptidase (beta-lactamase class C family)